MKSIKWDFASIPQNVKGIIYALIVLFGNGVHPIINNSRPATLNALHFSFLMSLIEFIIAIPFFIRESHLKRRQQFPPLEPMVVKKEPEKSFFLRDNCILVMVGSIFSVATYFYVEGMREAGSIPSSIALKSSPIYAFFLGLIFLKEKPNKKQIFFTLAMLGGLYYLGTEGQWTMGSFSVWFAILLGVPLLWTIAHTLTKPLLESGRISTLHVICIRTGVIAVVLGSFSIIVYGWESFAAIFHNPYYYLYGFLMGGTYFCMHWAWYNSIKTIHISYASALVTPSPVITTLIAVLFLHNPFHLYEFIGMVVVILSLYGLILANPAKKKNKKMIPEMQSSIILE